MAGPLLLRSLWSTGKRSLSSPSASSLHLKSYLSSARALSTAANAAAAAVSPNSTLDPGRLRNVAVIAHVDHGKTTLMDRLLRQCGADIPHERAMDSISLERERGITIASKVTGISWRENELNMVDTPGHADFGGEVERVVGMVEGAILVVDAGEGPLAQTKFVLAKALKYGLRPILLLNKVDRPAVSEERCDEVESLVFDLFANLGATDEQLDFPVLYASAKEGWASSTFTKDPPADVRNMSQLLDAIIRHVPPPKASLDAPFQMLVTMMEKDFYLGRILTGRVSSGVVSVGDKVHGLRITDSGTEKIEEGKVTKLMKKKGTGMVLIDSAGAGDIISVAGMTKPSIGHTVANTEVTTALPTIELDPPTISMTFGVNDSPLAGRDGTHLTGGKIGARLMSEAETNLAINVIPGMAETYEVQGRGELQLGILIENMRREGFELSVSPPKVMYKTENGVKLEPIEEVTIEVNEEHVGLVMEALSHRKAEVMDMGPVPGSAGRTKLSLTCPSRGLVGYRSVFSSDTRGTGFMHRAFLKYEKHRGLLGNVRKGVLVSMGFGSITAHALMSLEPRGILFVPPGTETYDGMIIGEHSRDTDLDVNPVRAKELSNVRAAGKDENVKLTPPRLMTLEEAIGYVASDELIEVTPKAIRLRKRYLDVNKRKTMSKRPKE
ncbi:Tr-type G domain-containing protein [Citrus sinensis]|uniref:Tr-type G domain-containing protein n=1 Tax=Citrus sinensis TaxID=2711 RepID=A0ACB8N0A8_CITSI|nr:Tr-type G domain-containing protein [Citrus sinensis]